MTATATKAKKPTQRDRILARLSDRQWHDTAELNAICFRYGARLFELRNEGYLFDEERIGAGPLWRWRLVLTPAQVVLVPHLERSEADYQAKREVVRGGSVNVAGPEGGCKAAADAASHVRERGSPHGVETLHKPARPALSHDGLRLGPRAGELAL